MRVGFRSPELLFPRAYSPTTTQNPIPAIGDLIKNFPGFKTACESPKLYSRLKVKCHFCTMLSSIKWEGFNPKLIEPHTGGQPGERAKT
jgi:hypothetical protein